MRSLTPTACEAGLCCPTLLANKLPRAPGLCPAGGPALSKPMWHRPQAQPREARRQRGALSGFPGLKPVTQGWTEGMAGNALSSGTLPGCQAPQQAMLLALRGIEEQPWPQWTDGETEAQRHHTYWRVKRVRNIEGLSWGASEGHDLLYAQGLSREPGPTKEFQWLGPILKDPDGSGTEANREGLWWREAHGLFPTSSPANAAHPPGRGWGAAAGGCTPPPWGQGSCWPLHALHTQPPHFHSMAQARAARGIRPQPGRLPGST